MTTETYSPSELNRIKSRCYSRAMFLLKKKYPKEFQEYFETKAYGDSYNRRYQSTLRHLRFRHPRVFLRSYKSFLELEGIK